MVSSVAYNSYCEKTTSVRTHSETQADLYPMLEQADVIDKATIEKDGGDMVSHHGDKKEWL